MRSPSFRLEASNGQTCGESVKAIPPPCAFDDFDPSLSLSHFDPRRPSGGWREKDAMQGKQGSPRYQIISAYESTRGAYLRDRIFMQNKLRVSTYMQSHSNLGLSRSRILLQTEVGHPPTSLCPQRLNLG